MKSDRPGTPTRCIALLALAAWSVVASVRQTLAHDPVPPPRTVHVRALLEGSQVVRPPEFQPPLFGTESEAVGEASLAIDTVSGDFTFDLRVDGIDPAVLDDNHGPNRTAIHIRQGSADEFGRFVADVHYYARESLPERNGVTATATGFQLLAQGVLSKSQGNLVSSYSLDEVIDFLRSEDTFVTVHTTSNDLTRHGEIRGKLQVVPARISLHATLQRSETKGGMGESVGEGSLAVNTVDGYFSFDLRARGVDPLTLDNAHGPNGTAVHIRTGSPETPGPIILDVHYFARQDLPDKNGVTVSGDGFHLHAEARLTAEQGGLDTGLSPANVVDFLRNGGAFVDVRTETGDPTAEIRGPLILAPDTVHLRALLDESQVVRPVEFRPPSFGTGSKATGEANLVIDKNTGRFSFDLRVDGIDPDALDDSHGDNQTAVHVHWGAAIFLGPIIIDVHYFADDIEPTETGFRLHAEGAATRLQGFHDIRFNLDQVMSFLRNEDAYVCVHTLTDNLSTLGEIRGNMRVVPPKAVPETIRFTASLDGRQVVRPPTFQPPEFGTESEAAGEANLVVNTTTGQFAFDLRVRGIDPLDLYFNQASNHTAVLIYQGTPVANGPILLDVHFFALLGARENQGITATEDGFSMHAAGLILRSQGLLDTTFQRYDIVDALRNGEAYVAVHTETNDLFTWGEIRGQLVSRDLETSFQRGDANGDGALNLSDAVFALSYLFLSGPTPLCLKSADLDDNGTVVLNDPVFLLNTLFRGGPTPPEPVAGCGQDATPDDLSCEWFPLCR